MLLCEDHPTGAGDFLGVSAPSFKWLTLIPSVWQWHRLFGFNSMLNFLGFSAQLIVIASIISVIISCASLPHSCIVVTSEDHPSGAEPLCNVSDSDASLSSARACAKSIISASYTVVIDEPVRLADDLSVLTIRQLKALCKSRSVKGYGNLRKHELVELLSAL